MAKHDEEVAPLGIHQLAYASNTDPASDSSITMRPYKGWIDTGNSNKLQVRNAANTDWEDISIGGAAGAPSFGSNSASVTTYNDNAGTVAAASAHHHIGVTSVSHASNTFSGRVILTASGVLGITSPTPGTLNLSATGGSGGGGGTPDAHAASHESGGSDEIDVTGLTGAGGGGLSMPEVIQVVQNGNAATSITIAAAASGNSLILFTNSTTGQVTSPTCTNVTWTQVLTATSSGAFYAIWVGVVAGGASGTTVTMTKPGDFNTVTVLEVPDALTPTIGGSGTRAVSTGSQLTELNLLIESGTTAGRFVVFAAGADNTTTLIRMHPSIPTSGSVEGVGNCLSVGYVPDTYLTMQLQIVGSVGVQMIAEIT